MSPHPCPSRHPHPHPHPPLNPTLTPPSPHPHPTHLRTSRPERHLALSSPQVRITLTGGAHYTPEALSLSQTARVGCLPGELQKHNAFLMRQLASHAYQQVP